MKRKVLLFVMMLSVSFLYAGHLPILSQDFFELQTRIAGFWNLGPFDPLLELQGRFEDTDLEFRYRALTAGAYYRLHRNVKIGAFYRLQAGARHDDDWIDLNPGWEWIDSRSRLEHIVILDVSPRFQLDFLPGQNWILMVKGRYLLNTFNMQQSILLRPGLTYFLMHNREPVINFSLNYDLYFPLNFGTTLLYEHWPYLNILYHLNRNIKLELTGAYKTVNWSASEDLIADGTPDWQGTQNSWVVGVGVLFVFGQ
jgi:hypothetical protein